MEGIRLSVIGAGVMGTGVTTLALGHGVPVLLVDVDQAHLERARARVGQQLRMAQMMGELPRGRTPGRLTTDVTLDAVAGSTAVIEAVTELPDVKAKVLAEASALVRAGTVVVTNTSSFPVDEMADAVARPQDLIGTHFMNPAYLIRTAEVIRGRRTGDAALAGVRAVLTALGRQPVVVNDAPGFVTSRVLHPMINDAARVVQEGTASAEAVDTLMQGCLGHRTGPLRTADLIGIDNLVDSLWVLHERTGDEGCRPCDLLLEKVRTGHHGRKSGRGFYEYGEPLS
ncbi:3-hydroxyacyl-CoA dehydrogenase family protein [Streptomyces sp. NPDC060000]|uniref:3-hydroxyacyl-CoA dehydrogenase family protein n=1 Tax=Streptomyces sp. NPDC060000 TaxID=3347031 RepID=UPI0036C3EAE9